MRPTTHVDLLLPVRDNDGQPFSPAEVAAFVSEGRWNWWALDLASPSSKSLQQTTVRRLLEK